MTPALAEWCGWAAGAAVGGELVLDLDDLGARSTAELVAALVLVGEPSARDGWTIKLERRDPLSDIDVVVTVAAPPAWYLRRQTFTGAGVNWSSSELEPEALELVRAISRGWVRGVRGDR